METVIKASTFQSLIRTLQQDLADPLQLRRREHARAALSPPLSYGRHFGPPLPSARQAAVMIMLEPREGAWSIPLTERPSHLPDHPGQISLPGGRLEAGESYREAAEREFVEELGCGDFPGQVVGSLLPIYVYNSDYFVQPFVAVCQRPFELNPCPDEVHRVFHLPVDPQSHRFSSKSFSRGPISWTAPTIEFNGVVVWGATAIILAELLAVRNKTPESTKRRIGIPSPRS